MQLLAPDILEEACKLSTPIHATALAIGVLLWGVWLVGPPFLDCPNRDQLAVGFVRRRPSLRHPAPGWQSRWCGCRSGNAALSLVRLVAFMCAVWWFSFSLAIYSNT